MAPAISLKPSCMLSSFLLSTRIRTSLSSIPRISTLDISVRSSIFSSKNSPYSFNWSRENSPDILIFAIGINSEKFSSNTFGSAGKSVGKSGWPIAASTLSFTFLKASSGDTSKLNLTWMVEYPSTEVELMASTPEIPLISFSKGRVISFSKSTGEFPGYGVPT